MIDPDHGNFEPLVAGELAQGRQSVYRRSVPDQGLLMFGFQHSVLPARRVGDPSGDMLVVQ